MFFFNTKSISCIYKLKLSHCLMKFIIKFLYSLFICLYSTFFLKVKPFGLLLCLSKVTVFKTKLKDNKSFIISTFIRL